MPNAHPDSSLDTARWEQLRRLQSEFGRYWQSLRQRSTRPCLECGALMPDVITTRRYCSPACLARAWRRRHPEYRDRARARRTARHTPPTTAPPTA